MDRIEWVDLLKVFGILGVIVIHITSCYLEPQFIYKSNWYQGVIIESLARFGIILFLMATGYLILRKEQSISVIPRRLKRVGIPFLFWFIICVLAKSYILHVNFFVLLGKGFLDPTIISIEFWYVYMIIGLYLFSPILSKWIHNTDIKEIEFFLGIWVFVLFINFFDIDFLLIDYLRYFSGCIGYFVLGYYLAVKKSDLLKSRKFGFGLFVVGSLICIFGIILNPQMLYSFIQVGDLTPNALLQAVGLFIIIKNTDFNKFSTRVRKAIEKLSIKCYGIFLSNVLVIHLFRKFGIITFTNIAVVNIIIDFIIVTAVCYFIIAIMDRIPALKEFSGC